MIGLLIAIHVAACALLIIIILIQTGRGGGLVESLSNVESMFGTKTSMFLTRATGILAVLFFLSCIGLAFLSAKQSKSLLSGITTKPPAQAVQQEPAGTKPANQETDKQTPAKQENTAPLKQENTLPVKQ